LKCLPYLAFETGWLRIPTTTDFLKRGEFDREGPRMGAVEGMQSLRQWLTAKLLTPFKIDGSPLGAPLEAYEVAIQFDVVVAREFIFRARFD
jgi:hypothetical protein